MLGERLQYTAVDIGDSDEAQRRAPDMDVVTYDGVTLPFDDGSFDAVLSVQVLEHCSLLEQVVAEMSRVCRTDGFVMGSTSNLEPYHSRSLWSITPYGLLELFTSNGLNLLELAPGIDGRALLERSFTNDRNTYDRYFSSLSPLNAEIVSHSRERNISRTRTLVRMLRYSGHYFFIAQRRGQ